MITVWKTLPSISIVHMYVHAPHSDCSLSWWFSYNYCSNGWWFCSNVWMHCFKIVFSYSVCNSLWGVGGHLNCNGTIPNRIVCICPYGSLLITCIYICWPRYIANTIWNLWYHIFHIFLYEIETIIILYDKKLN